MVASTLVLAQVGRGGVALAVLTSGSRRLPTRHGTRRVWSQYGYDSGWKRRVATVTPGQSRQRAQRVTVHHQRETGPRLVHGLHLPAYDATLAGALPAEVAGDGQHLLDAGAVPDGVPEHAILDGCACWYGTRKDLVAPFWMLMRRSPAAASICASAIGKRRLRCRVSYCSSR